MKKEEVLALVADKKAAAGQVFDDIASAVDSIEVQVVDGDSAALQAQIADLQKQLSDLQAAKALEDVDLDSVKASLQDAMAKLSKDEDALAKFKAILAELAG